MSTPRDVTALAAIFAGSAAIHLLKPDVWEPLMPRFVPAQREVILGSGLLELACAVGLMSPRFRRPAGWVSAAVLVGVFPANLKMAGDAAKSSSTGFKAAAFGRLPLQVPMIRIALKATRDDGRNTGS